MQTGKKTPWRKAIWRDRKLYLLILPGFILTIIFAYVPTWGLLTAFFDYNPGLPLLESEFVGLKYFKRFFSDPNFGILLRNSLAISLLNIAWGTLFPIVFAVLLNEVSNIYFKRTVQTISYLPHFISYVVIANIAQTIFATNGPLNQLLISTGIIDTGITYFAEPKMFWWLVSGINIWKEMGWSAIIYMAAIAGIDPTLYEAAMIDGAGRFKRMWYITIKEITPTIVVLLILAVPDLLNAGFDPSFLLGNSIVLDYSEVLDTFVYKIGLQKGQYSYATAIGLCRQVVSLILILGANTFARKTSEYSLF